MNTNQATKIVYLNGHGETCTNDTIILYLQLHSGNQFKLGKGGGELGYIGKTPLEAIRDGRYKGVVAYSYPIIFVLSRTYACELVGKEFTEEMKHGNEMPKLDDFVRRQLGKPWTHNLGIKGAKKLGLDTEALVGHAPELDDVLIKQVKQILKLEADVGRIELKLRFSQENIDLQLQRAFLTNDRVALIAFGGFGKSYLSLRNASFLWQKKQKGYVLCLTTVVDNIDDFKQASEQFQFLGKRVEFIRLNELTAAKFHKKIAECKLNKWVPFIVATVQDIRGNDSAEDDESEEAAVEAQKKLDTKYKFLSEEPLAALLQDEVHAQYAAERTAKALQKLNPKYILDMTATMGRREMAEFGYSQDQIVSYSMLQALEAKRNGTDPDMINMPDLEFRVHRNIVVAASQLTELGATVEDGWCSAKAFALKNGKFLYPRWMLKIIADTFALNVQMKEWKHAVTAAQNTGVHLMILPRGGNGEGTASDKCRLAAKMVNDQFDDEVHAISAYELRERANSASRTLADQVAFEIERYGKNKKVLIITHRVLLTGVNMPQLETIALFDRIGSSKLFMQTAYRLFRKYQYADGSWKTNTVFAVFEPNVAIADTSAEAAIGGLLADHKNEGDARVRELHNLISLNVYDGMEHHEVTAQELLAAQEAAAAAEWKEKFSNITDGAIESSIDAALKTELLGLAIVGKGTSNGNSDGEKTQVTEDNGSETFKSGQKKAHTNFEKKEADDWSKRLEIIIAMLGQAKFYAVHRAWVGTLGENLDIVQVMSSKQVTLTWGEANQKLVIEALKSSTLKEFMNNHLKAVNGELLNSTLAEAIMVVGGAVGPTKPEAGQKYRVLDNQSVVDLVFNRKTRRLNPKTVKVVHPKSGLLALVARNLYPNARIVCEAMNTEDTIFDDVLEQLNIEQQKEDMKFDLIVGNPPYLAGMHITFLEECFKQLSSDGMLVFVHPATPFIKQGKGVKDIDLALTQHVKSLEFKNPALVFGGSAQLASPVSITTLTKAVNEKIIVEIDGHISEHTSLDTVSIHAGHAGYNSFKQRMVALSDRLVDHAIYPKNKQYASDEPYYVELSGLVGDFPRNAKNQETVADFFVSCFFYAGKTMQVTPKADLKATGAKYAYAFPTEEEAVNCLSYLQTKFARACLAIFKYNLHVYPAQLSTTPWMDFSRSWTDAQLFEHFNLSEDEKQFVRSMSNLYPNYSEE